MTKIEGIKSIDFKITALGHGVVNWNGSPALRGKKSGMDETNHGMPKLRGYTNLTGEKSEKGHAYKKEADDVDFKETPLYISQNCIRHHLFKNQAFDWHYLKNSNINIALTSLKGLLNGYVVPSSQCKRTSSLLIEDFVDELGNGNFEQFSSLSMKEVIDDDGNATYKRDENSIFSKTTFGNTKYTSYGSISIEQLQLISLDNKFDRAAMVIKEGQGEEVAQQVQDFIKSLNPELEPNAVFHQNYVRAGTIFEEGEEGILLDDVAIKVLTEEMLSMLANLSIRQAKGYMYVDEIEVDYNDSLKMMRIKRGDITSPEASTHFATYFYAKNK